MSEREAMVELVRKAIQFADWAAGEGISPIEGESAEDPAEFLCEYSQATGDEDWETLADRVAAAIRSGEKG